MRTFTIRFEHEGKPLVGVTATIWNTANKTFERISGRDGIVRFVGVPAGMYSLSARLRGMRVAASGFRVAVRSTQKSLVVKWDERAIESRTISGKLLWGDEPVRLAEMTLTNLASGKTARVFTNDWGLFRFDSVRDAGDYKLYSEGGSAPGSGPLWSGRSMLVRLNPSAQRESMALTMELGSCGGRMFLIP